jgi:hypothetical protein
MDSSRKLQHQIRNDQLLVAYNRVDGMQGKREIIQQSGGHSARTRLTGPRHTPHGETTRARTAAGPHVSRLAAGPPENAAAGGREGGRGGGGILRRREVRGGRRWRGVDRVLSGPYGPPPPTEAGVGPTKGAGDDDWGMGLS